MKRLIIYLIRKRLGLKKEQMFRFVNQKDDSYYYFKDDIMMKHFTSLGVSAPSNVSLNWLLDDSCKIEVKVK